MVENAINKLLSHAKRVAGIIGLKEVKIKNINIEGDNRYPPVPYPKQDFRKTDEKGVYKW